MSNLISFQLNIRLQWFKIGGKHKIAEKGRLEEMKKEEISKQNATLPKEMAKAEKKSSSKYELIFEEVKRLQKECVSQREFPED